MNISRYQQAAIYGGIASSTIYCGISTGSIVFFAAGMALAILTSYLTAIWERDDAASLGEPPRKNSGGWDR